jgi:hypothetical protein
MQRHGVEGGEEIEGVEGAEGAEGVEGEVEGNWDAQLHLSKEK